MKKTIISIILFFTLVCTQAFPQGPVISFLSVCVDSATIQAPPLQAGETGVWTATSIPERNKYIQHPDKNVTVVNELFRGENYFTWTVTKGDKITEYFVRVTNNSVEYYTYAGEDKYITKQDIIAVSLDSKYVSPFYNYDYSWEILKGQGEFEDSTRNITTVYNPGKGVNIYRWRVRNMITGCEAYDDVIIEMQNIQKNTRDDKFTCEETIELSAHESLQGDGLWEITTGTGEFQDINSYKTTVSNLDDGINTFKWNIMLNDLENSSLINIVKGYSIDAGPDISTCNDSCSLSFDMVLPEGAGFIKKSKVSYSWEIISGSGIITYNKADSSTISISNLQPGENTFRVSSELMGCTSSDTITITYNKPGATFDILKSDTCPKPMVELQAQADIMDTSEINYYWSFGDGEHNFCGGEHITHNYKAKAIDTTYTIQLIAQNENGCEALAELEHKVIACSSASVKMMEPKITFSPNPVITHLRISQTQSEACINTIKIFNLEGYCIRKFNSLKALNMTINMEDLNAGVYIIWIQTSKQSLYKKIIKAD